MDTHTTLLTQLEVLTKKLLGATIVHANENVNQAQALRCEFYEQGHTNGNCIPEGFTEEAQYANNYPKGNPYSNTYNQVWKYHLNLKWSNNTSLNPVQGNP